MDAQDEGNEFEFEDGLPDDFVEPWTVRAEKADGRQRFFMLHPSAISNRFRFGGPIFNLELMVASIIDRMNAGGTVGYSWAIARNGILAACDADGDARTPNEDNPQKMTKLTRMTSASLAKTICAVAVMKLVEDKALSLNEPVYPHIESAFPSVDASVKLVTIRQLLTHTAGFKGSTKLSKLGDVLSNPVTPSSDSKYHNAHYWVAALVVEGVTGGTYLDYIDKNITAPISAKSIGAAVDANPCLYYRSNSNVDGFAWKATQSTAPGAAGLNSHVVDWVRFLVYFREDLILSKGSRLTMLNAPEKYFGFRHWFNQPRGMYYGHGGDYSSNGRAFHGGIMGFPDGVDAALLINSDDVSNPETILRQAYHDAYA